jgi:hypothetical protein
LAASPGNSTGSPIEYVGGFGGSVVGPALNGTVAYIGEGSSLTLIDIHDPSHPTRLARLPLPYLPAELALDGGRLYIADNSGGLLIYDASDPVAPKRLGALATAQPATRVRAQGGLAFVIANTLLTIDVSDPAAPHQLGSFSPGLAINNLAVAGARAYLALGSVSNGFGGGVDIVDVANPAAPALLSYTRTLYEAVLDVKVDGALMYAITATGPSQSLGSSRLLIADTSNVASPVIRGSTPLPQAGGSTSRASLLVAGGLAVVAGYPGGLLTLDVHTPTAPALLGSGAGLGGSAGLQLSGELLYAVTDGLDYAQSHFQVISLHTPASPTQLGGYRTFPLITGVAAGSGMASITHYDGYQLLDVHDPAQPAARGGYPLAGGPSRVQQAGNLAYVTGGNSGFNIFDISNPDTPARLGGLDPNGSTLDIRVIGNRAYLVYLGELAILDVSNPSSLMQLGAFIQTTGFPDAGVDVVGSRAYFATGNQGLVVLDVSDPAHPLATGSYTALARTSYVQVADRRAYVAAGSDGLVILDLANPDHPTRLGQARGAQFAIFVRVVAGLAFVADYYGGVLIYDVRTPTAPTLVAQYSLGGTASSIAVDGNMMYVASGGAGLQIARLNLDQLAASAPVGASGGVVATIDSSVNLSVPPGAVSGTATLTVTPALDPALPPDSSGTLLRAVALEAQNSQGQPLGQFDLPYTLTISYTDAQLAAQNIDEDSLRARLWDGNAWVAPPACAQCGIDKTQNRATFAATRLSTFALVGNALLAFTSAAPPTALAGRPYRHVFSATGSPAPTYHITAGVLPPGLSLDPASGALAGVPTTPGTYHFTIAASNGQAPDAAQPVTLTVRGAAYLPIVVGPRGG